MKTEGVRGAYIVCERQQEELFMLTQKDLQTRKRNGRKRNCIFQLLPKSLKFFECAHQRSGRREERREVREVCNQTTKQPKKQKRRQKKNLTHQVEASSSKLNLDKTKFMRINSHTEMPWKDESGFEYLGFMIRKREVIAPYKKILQEMIDFELNQQFSVTNFRVFES